MRRDELYLRDIIEAADAIASFIANADENAFVENDLLRSATLHKLMLIGEATNGLSDELKSRYPGERWRDIIVFRNIAIHSYFRVDWAIVWVTATKEAPALRTRLLEILATEFPKSPLNVWMTDAPGKPESSNN